MNIRRLIKRSLLIAPLAFVSPAYSIDTDNDGVLDFQQVPLLENGAISDLWSRWSGYEEYELGVSSYCDFPHNASDDIPGECAKLSWYVTDDSTYDSGVDQVSSVIELNQPPFVGLGGSTLNLTRDWDLGPVNLSYMQDGFIQFDLKVTESPNNQKLWVGLYGDTGVGWLEFDAPDPGSWTTITIALKDLNAPGGEGPYEGDLSAVWWPFMIDQWDGLESRLVYRLGNISFVSHHNGLDSNSEPADMFPLDPQEHMDTDGDGVGDNGDSDDDGDGVEDSLDIAPLNNLISGFHDLLDIDGNGLIDPLTDGMIIMRYMFGFTGDALTDGVIGEGATRATSEEIEVYLELVMPGL